MNAAQLATLLVVLVAGRVEAQPHRIGDGLRPQVAPRTLGEDPEVLEVAHGLVWVRLKDGTTTSSATKVPSGVYLTAEAWANASGAFSARGARLADLERQLSAASAELAHARGLPSSPCPPVTPAPPLRTLEPEARPGFPWAAVLVVGAVAFAGGVYLGATTGR